MNEQITNNVTNVLQDTMKYQFIDLKSGSKYYSSGV